MGCVFCGEGDKWIKTCLARDGSRLLLCDPCYEVLSESNAAARLAMRIKSTVRH